MPAVGAAPGGLRPGAWRLKTPSSRRDGQPSRFPRLGLTGSVVVEWVDGGGPVVAGRGERPAAWKGPVLQETRGRPCQISPKQLQRLDTARKELIRRAKGEAEVRITDIMREAHIEHVSESTVSKHFKKLGVSRRVPREEPLRQASDSAERVRICRKWAYLPNNYFTDKVDTFLDNKRFAVPTYPRARAYSRMARVRGHLRTRSEGLKKGFTKPKTKKTAEKGGTVNVCAAIINCKVKVWEYLPRRWSGAAAADLYAGPIAKTLRRCRGHGKSFIVLEDNDPTGYKSRAGVEARPGRRNRARQGQQLQRRSLPSFASQFQKAAARGSGIVGKVRPVRVVGLPGHTQLDLPRRDWRRSVRVTSRPLSSLGTRQTQTPSTSSSGRRFRGAWPTVPRAGGSHSTRTRPA